MRTADIGVLLSILAWTPHAWADFIISSPLPGSLYAAQGSSAEEHEAQRPGPAAPQGRVRPAPMAFGIALGFGDQVPLRFAVRQIVPRNVKVIYGPGADPDAAVTWKGGRGWNWVLLHAVQPLGLRLVMTPMAVELRE